MFYQESHTGSPQRRQSKSTPLTDLLHPEQDTTDGGNLVFVYATALRLHRRSQCQNFDLLHPNYDMVHM